MTIAIIQNICEAGFTATATIAQTPRGTYTVTLSCPEAPRERWNTGRLAGEFTAYRTAADCAVYHTTH